MYFANVLVTVNLLSVCGIFGQQFRGDVCTVKSSGKKGLCKFITDCAEAIAGLQKGKIPDICGFEGSQSIVCCPGGQERTPGDIANKKCKEYSQYVWQVDLNPVLLVGAPDIKRNECPFDKQELIVGGERASRREFPHMVQIGYEGDPEPVWKCGGTLISENFVMTAGHCLSNRFWGDAKYARMGLTDQDDERNVQQRDIIERIGHPDYVETSHYNDIGLVKLNRAAKLNSWARPACIHTRHDLPPTNVIATGWGLIEHSGSTSNYLLRVVLELYNQQKCNKTYRSLAGSIKLKNGIEDDLMVCAGSSKALRDACQGDSGGPLQVYKEGQNEMSCMYDIIGVTSFGKACGLALNVPGVYTRVSHYVKWIEDIVWP